MYLDFKEVSIKRDSNYADKKISSQSILIIDNPSKLDQIITSNNHYHNFLLAKKLAHFSAEIIEDKLNEINVKDFNRITLNLLQGKNDKKNLLQILQEVRYFDYKKSKKPYF
jgi:hypothetical protein